jgi:alkyldihydroxyacetonephosphate synthase
LSLVDLQARVPALRISTRDTDRLNYARDLYPLTHIWMGEAKVGQRPRAICWPASTQEVAAVVQWALETATPLVPYGAGSGVCGGTLPGPDTLIVDLKAMRAVVDFDERSLLVRVQPGMLGEDLERWLAKRGYTLGHFPSSIYCSSVGGWLAARSGGQFSTKYGKIEDMVVSQELVLPDGKIVRTATTPRAATGPDWDQLFVGSEGTLGFITEATLRVCLAPEIRHFRAFRYPSVPAALEGMRAVMQAGLRPAVTRLYDEIDTFLVGSKKPAPESKPFDAEPMSSLKGKLKGEPAFLQAAHRAAFRHPKLIHALVDALPGSCLLIFMFEGNTILTDAEASEAWAILKQSGGKDLGSAPAEAWYETRYHVSYRQSAIYAADAFVDTCEVATTWSAIEDLYFGMLRAVRPHAIIMAHFSHAYHEGVNIYFTFAAHAGDADGKEQLYQKIWKTLMESCLRYGGTISHHHGIGFSKQAWLAQELGGGMEVFQAAKRALDPHGIMNPGKMGLGNGGRV